MVPLISIPEIRDYQRINAEVARRLDEGHERVRLMGAEGQRLLVAGHSGPWRAVIEIHGRAGPELAAELDAPGLSVVCHGSAADGVARGLRNGLVVVRGDVGVALGYSMSGGGVVVTGEAGPRSGLDQAGGVILVLGRLGRLAGERQSGGSFFALEGMVGEYAGRGRVGGRFLELAVRRGPWERLERQDDETLREVLGRANDWMSDHSSPLFGEN